MLYPFNTYTYAGSSCLLINMCDKPGLTSSSLLFQRADTIFHRCLSITNTIKDTNTPNSIWKSFFGSRRYRYRDTATGTTTAMVSNVESHMVSLRLFGGMISGLTYRIQVSRTRYRKIGYRKIGLVTNFGFGSLRNQPHFSGKT